MIKKVQSYRGFTLIELLIVIAIVGVLVALAFPNFFAARQRARDVQRKSDLKQIQKALELAKSDISPVVAYPTSGASNRLPVGCVTPWLSSSGNAYLPKTPCDPNGPTPYYYQLNPADSLRYNLIACLENGSDPDKDSVNNAAVCTTANTYSYTLTEP